MGRGQVDPTSGFFLTFFSVRSATLNFLEFCFYALRRFLANIQGYRVFRSKVIPNCMKKSTKKGQKSQNLLKRETDKKEHIKLPFFFAQKFHTILI